MPLYEEYANTDGLPDMTEVLDDLGVRVDEDRVTFNNNSSLAVIREAISAAR